MGGHDVHAEQPSSPDQPATPAVSPPAASLPLLFEAIVRRRCINAVYNRVVMRIAPHVVYTRHDDIFVDGVVEVKDGRLPREEKIAAFKLAGLRDIVLTGIEFRPSALFDATDAKYATALLVVDPVEQI